MGKIKDKYYGINFIFALTILLAVVFIGLETNVQQSSTLSFSEAQLSPNLVIGGNEISANLSSLKVILSRQAKDQSLARSNLKLIKSGQAIGYSQLPIAEQQYKALIYNKSRILSHPTKLTPIKIGQINYLKLADDQQVFEIKASKLVQLTILAAKNRNYHGDVATNLTADFTTVDGDIQAGYTISSNTESSLASQNNINYEQLSKTDILLQTASSDNNAIYNTLEAINHILMK